jgi:hypothetical protein
VFAAAGSSFAGAASSLRLPQNLRLPQANLRPQAIFMGFFFEFAVLFAADASKFAVAASDLYGVF